jgi:hypothetical protein
LPSWPDELSPQQKADPSFVIAQVCRHPAAICRNETLAGTGTGKVLAVRVPSPS